MGVRVEPRGDDFLLLVSGLHDLGFRWLLVLDGDWDSASDNCLRTVRFILDNKLVQDLEFASRKYTAALVGHLDLDEILDKVVEPIEGLVLA